MMTMSCGIRKLQLLAIVAGFQLTVVVAQPYPREGQVRTLGVAANEMAEFLSDEYEEWLNESFEALVVFPPWFPSELYQEGFVYKDLYAIHDCRLPRNPDDPLVEPDDPTSICAGANPYLLDLYQAAMSAENDPLVADWILKDTQGNNLYIPFPDEHGRYTQFAADFRNTAFGQLWVTQMSFMLAEGEYSGIFIDNVNMERELSLSNGICRLVDVGAWGNCYWAADINDEEWAAGLVTWVQTIRDTFTDRQIIHNSVWFHTAPEGYYLDAQIEAADIINVERGVHDAGLNANNMPNFFAFHDLVHGLGKRISHYIRVYGEGSSNSNGVLGHMQELEHGLAGWLLASSGRDLFGADRYMIPGYWWEGFGVDLGRETAGRYISRVGLYGRHFEGGIVLLNPNAAGGLSASMNFGGTLYRTLNGDCVSQITVPPGTGRILLRGNNNNNSCGP